MKQLIIVAFASLFLLLPSPKPIQQGDGGQVGITKAPQKIAELPQSALTAESQESYIPVKTGATSAPVSSSVANCGDNSYANFIYMHESGCSLYNPNPTSGACGLGQANPCSKLTAVCPNLDYACENTFFTGYANTCVVGRMYCGWAGAYAFWLANSWW